VSRARFLLRSTTGLTTPVLLASLIYIACDLAIWRPGISFGLAVGAIGSSRSSDYQVMTWGLEWWPWAIQHGLNPLHTGLVWAPSGYPTTWMTSIPAPSLLAAPITLLAGPLVSYNLLMLAAPPAAALACYWLCRELCGRWWPSLLGGFLFGFSPYVLGQAVAQHLNLVMVWPLPLLALTAVRYCRGDLSTRRALLASVGLGLFLLGSSLELFATTVTLGGIVLLIALAFDRGLRRRLVSLTGMLAAALLIVLAFAAPIIWIMIGQSPPPLPFPPKQYATDIANVLVPTRLTLGGTTSAAHGISGHFVGNLGEEDGYLGLPLVGVCLVAAWRDWRRRAWIAASAVVVALGLSLGPALVIAGHTVADIPFAMDRLPVVGLALPSRLAVFVMLAAICLAVRWLARRDLQRVRIALGVAIAVSFAPQLGALSGARADANAQHPALPGFAWAMPHASLGFVKFADRFAPHTTVLGLPFGGLSPAIFWQAETDMRFRVAGGYTPFAPADSATDPLVAGFLTNTAPPLAVYRLRAYIVRTNTTIVLVQSFAREWLRIVRAATDERPRLVAGIAVFPVDARRMRELLEQPRRSGRGLPGIALSARGTPLASLTASSNGRLSVVGWLTYDWRTWHVAVQALTRADGWSRATTLSNPRDEASDFHVAVGGRRSVAAWIEAHDGAATLRVAEFRRGRWKHVALPKLDAVTLSDAVAIAPSGVATVAWTAQVGPRAVLHALRIGVNGRVSAVETLSSAMHSVDAFAIAAARRKAVVAWRERDSTRTGLYTSTLASRARAWQRPQGLPGSGSASAPIVRIGAFGPVVTWVNRASKRAGLEAYRLDARDRATGLVTLARSRRQVISPPSVLRSRGGVLVAWCARTSMQNALHVAFLTATRVERRHGQLASCAGIQPNLVAAGAQTLLNGIGSRPRLYLLTSDLGCSRLSDLHLGGAYRLLAGASGLEAVTGSGAANGTVTLRTIASLRHGTRSCAPRRHV
jgi:hypothetical protein